MLAMNGGGEEFLVFSAMLMTFAFATFWLSHRHKLKVERQRTMQKALESPVLDDAMRRQMVDLLTAGDRDGLAAVARNFVPTLRVLVFVAGWLMMIIGIALTVMSFVEYSMGRNRFGFVMSAVVGFALVTLPLALRELRARAAA